MKIQLTVLDSQNPNQEFPDTGNALTIPDGLLAVGGCLSPVRLLNAYRKGIFPWNSPNEPILWWSPDPRLVLFPEKLAVSRSLEKTLRKKRFVTTIDRAFGQVVGACAMPRKNDNGTWISTDIYDAYVELHRAGYAHSAETWLDGELVGGLYGITIGRVFFGESMFHRVTDASKVAFVELVRRLEKWGYQMVDCQVSTSHLKTLGAENIPREDFLTLLTKLCNEAPESSAWRS